MTLMAFYGAVPTLGGYQHGILIVRYGIGIYPLKMLDKEAQGGWQVLNNEDEFLSALKKTLSSDGLRIVVARLLTHVTAEQEAVS